MIVDPLLYVCVCVVSSHESKEAYGVRVYGLFAHGLLAHAFQSRLTVADQERSVLFGQWGHH